MPEKTDAGHSHMAHAAIAGAAGLPGRNLDCLD